MKLIGNKRLLNYSLQPAFVMKAQPGKLVHPLALLPNVLRNRDGGLNPNIALWNAYVGYHFNKDASLRLDARNLLDRHNVITNGDYEYWGRPIYI